MIRIAALAAALLLPAFAFAAGTAPPSAAAHRTAETEERTAPGNEHGERREGWRAAVMHPLAQAFLTGVVLAGLYAAAKFLRARRLLRRGRRIGGGDLAAFTPLAPLLLAAAASALLLDALGVL